MRLPWESVQRAGSSRQVTEREHHDRIREAAADVERVLEELKAARSRFRDAVIDAHEHGVSYTKIGRELGVSRQRVAQVVKES